MKTLSQPHWQRQFTGYGYRMTRPREAILAVMGKATDHLSAEDIFLAVHKFYPNIGLTTIYRNLELLVQMELVVKFEFGQGKAKYELAEGYSAKKHHHHLICKKCSRVYEYSDPVANEAQFLDDIKKGLAKKYHFQMTEHSIEFHGYCDKCQ